MSSQRIAAALAAGAAVLIGTIGFGEQAAYAQTPVGQAEGVQVRLLSFVSLDFAQTNALPATGAVQNAGVASVAVSGLVSTGVITASTMGTPLNGVNLVSSSAQVDGLRLLPPIAFGSTLLTAETVRSTTTASFGSSSGSTTIENLIFGGNRITVTGAANQMVSIDGVANLIINEQFVSNGVRTTNALHLTVLSGINAGEVTVSQSVAGFAGPAVGAPEPGAGTLALAFGPVLPALFAYKRRRKNAA